MHPLSDGKVKKIFGKIKTKHVVQDTEIVCQKTQ